jgi:hypothetical protein
MDMGRSCWVDKKTIGKKACEIAVQAFIIAGESKGQVGFHAVASVSQKTAQKAPEKKMPLTVVNVKRRSLKVQGVLTKSPVGLVVSVSMWSEIDVSVRIRLLGSILGDVGIGREYISVGTFFMVIWSAGCSLR